MSDTSKTQKLLQAGAEILGAGIGGAVGLLGGPMGAIGGGVFGVVVSKSLVEFSDRFLSHRERARVGAAASITILNMQNRIDNGHQLRQDNFFEANQLNRSKAEELFEGTLIKCKDEYEEKKIQYITRIYENVAFDSNIKPEHANQVLNSVQQLSFRQLAILAYVGQNQNNSFSVRDTDYRDSTVTVDANLQFVLQDFVLLTNQGLIFRADDTAVLDYSDIIPGGMALSLVGNEYFRLLNLSTMPNSEFNFLPLLT